MSATGTAQPVAERDGAGWIGAAALVGAALGAAGALTASAVALAFVRRVVTPSRRRPDDVEVLAVDDSRVLLRADPVTRAQGRYGLWTDRGRAHLRVGAVTRVDEAAGTVEREVLGRDVGTARAGRGRWSGWYHAGDPSSALGLAFDDVVVRSDVGDLPAWVVPPAPGSGAGSGAGAPSGRTSTWAVLVHGRGATREECLRALPVLHRLGLTCLVLSYRNDESGPTSPAGRYGLGDTEWVDVEAGVLHALAAGARDVVLVAWSMGGAIALSHLSRSWTADRVRAVVLDAPVLDWRDVLDQAARVNRVPAAIARSGLAVLGSPVARAVIGIDAPVDLRRLDWVTRAEELATPVLVLHSEDDETVPIGPSRALAAARPDLISLVPFTGAAHCREWNVAPERWEREVARFLLEHL